MTKPPTTKRGPATARVTFIKHQTTIQTELAEGWSALAIYERHKKELTSISYRQFLRYVAGIRPAKSGLAPQPKDAEPINARHKPSGSGAYYEPPRHDDATKDRLVGPRIKP